MFRTTHLSSQIFRSSRQAILRRSRTAPRFRSFWTQRWFGSQGGSDSDSDMYFSSDEDQEYSDDDDAGDDDDGDEEEEEEDSGPDIEGSVAPRQRGPTSRLPSIKARSKSNVPPGMSRREFEDEFHLNRALSRPLYTPEEKRKWAKMIQPRTWNLKPFVIHPSPPYELDALQNIHNRSFDCNVLLEIRDVRVPASSHHPSFTRLAKHRLHLICYTHADMIDAPTRDKVEDWTLRSWPDSRSIFVDTRENRSDLPYDMFYDALLGYLETRGGINSALTVGVPNTGKSCVLMALLRLARNRGDVSKKLKATVSYKKKRRLGKAAPVGIHDKPGKTRVITEYLLRDSPRAFFLDVPGITPPTFYFDERPESWFAFGAANLLPQSKSMEEDLQIQIAFCDYVLYCLNRDHNFHYVPKIGLPGPTDDIEAVLAAVKDGKYIKDEEKLQMHRCRNFLKLLNTGNLGPVILDDISRPYKNFVFKDSHYVKMRSKFDEIRQERDAAREERRGFRRDRGGGDDFGSDGEGRGGGRGRGRDGGGRGGRGRDGGGRGGGTRRDDKPLDDFDADDFQY